MLGFSEDLTLFLYLLQTTRDAEQILTSVCGLQTFATQWQIVWIIGTKARRHVLRTNNRLCLLWPVWKHRFFYSSQRSISFKYSFEVQFHISFRATNLRIVRLSGWKYMVPRLWREWTLRSNSLHRFCYLYGPRTVLSYSHNVFRFRQSTWYCCVSISNMFYVIWCFLIGITWKYFFYVLGAPLWISIAVRIGSVPTWKNHSGFQIGLMTDTGLKRGRWRSTFQR